MLDWLGELECGSPGSGGQCPSLQAGNRIVRTVRIGYRNSPIMHHSVMDEFKPAIFEAGASSSLWSLETHVRHRAAIGFPRADEEATHPMQVPARAQALRRRSFLQFVAADAGGVHGDCPGCL